MKDNLGFPDRRSVHRLKTRQLASYIRYDELGKPCEQTTAELIDVSLKGARLQSSLPVEPGEMLDVTLAFGNNLVRFKGKAVHMTPSQDGGFDLGISIEDIEDQQRIALIRLLSSLRAQVECLE